MDDEPGHLHHQRRRARGGEPAGALAGRLLHSAEDQAHRPAVRCQGPDRGAWLEFETSNKDLLSVKVDHQAAIPVTTLLRAVGVEDSAEMLKLFAPPMTTGSIRSSS